MNKEIILKEMLEQALKNGTDVITVRSLAESLGVSEIAVGHELAKIGIRRERRWTGSGRDTFIIFDKDEIWAQIRFEKLKYLSLFHNVTKCPECEKLTLVKKFERTFDGDTVLFKCHNCSHESRFPVAYGYILKKKINEKVPAIKVKCPYCDKEHRHSSKPLPGFRRAHCLPGPTPPGCYPVSDMIYRNYWVEVKKDFS